MKRLILIILCSLAVAALCTPKVAAAGEWRVHSTFDDDVSHVFVTPERIYMLGMAIPYSKTKIINAKKQHFLFSYDIEGDEMQNYTSDNRLSRTVVSAAEYNPDRGYLLVVYDNYDIDLLFDDGTKKNIPSYKSASVSHSKDINSITFDPERNRAYLSTAFGYVSINDEKGEIAESRIYNTPVESVCRLGDSILLLASGRLLAADASAPRLGMSDYKSVAEVKDGKRLLPMSDTYCVAIAGNDPGTDIYRIDAASGNIISSHWLTRNIVNIENVKEGYTVATDGNLIWLKPDGSHESLELHPDDKGSAVATVNMREIWIGTPRKGLRSKNYDQASQVWTLTRDYMRPNAAAPYSASAMAYVPEYGMLVPNHGRNWVFTDKTQAQPLLLSGLKNGEWSNYSPAYTNPEQTKIMEDPNGAAVDPDNSSLIYFGSYIDGIVRLDLSNPRNILHMARPGHPTSKLPGFIAIVPDQYGGDFDALCHFSDPQFDSAGNLWSSYNDANAQKNGAKLTLYYWPAENRRATTDVSSFQPWKVFEVKGYSPHNQDMLLPLRRTPNMLVYASNKSGFPITLIDHGGTLEDTSDDRVVAMGQDLRDDEGKSLDRQHIYAIFEDQSSGLVWIGHDTGVFTFRPESIFENDTDVKLIKVARNDGTNLADYLFANVAVYGITADSAGRKWFSTGGAGLVCTSPDGRTIIAEYTAENSDIPDNTVYVARYNPQNNSMLVSTAAGLAELYLSGMPTGGTDMSSVRVYPNPVRPDYYGFVTIDGLADNALVKIVDASGNLVKELDRASGGQTQWDTTNLNHNKVGSGVYYVMASAGDDSTSMAKVAKLLVVR